MARIRISFRATGNKATLYKAYLAATFTVIAWGASFIATKVAIQDISPVSVVWLRFTMGVAILGGAVVVRKQFSWPRRNELFYFVILGFLGITFHQWLQSTGLLTAQASTTAWIVATTPIFIALLGWMVLKEKLGFGQVLGIWLAAMGVLMVVTKGQLTAIAVGRFGTPGDRLVLISSVNWAVFSVLSRRVLQKTPATRMMFFVMGFGWIFTSFQFLFTGGLKEISQLTLNGWIGVVFLGVVCSGLAYIFWYDALKALPASLVGAFLYFEPLVAVLVAFVILGEPFGQASLLGGALILTGVWMVNRKARK
jgi:drug/metabolite transporter (DMT)-like permease